MGGLPREVGAAGGFASMLGNNNLWQCVVFVLSRVAWVGWPSEIFWLSVMLTFLCKYISIVLIERQSSCLLFKKKCIDRVGIHLSSMRIGVAGHVS